MMLRIAISVKKNYKSLLPYNFKDYLLYVVDVKMISSSVSAIYGPEEKGFLGKKQSFHLKSI